MGNNWVVGWLGLKVVYYENYNNYQMEIVSYFWGGLLQS